MVPFEFNNKAPRGSFYMILEVLYQFLSLCSGFWPVWTSYSDRLTCSPAAQEARTL